MRRGSIFWVLLLLLGLAGLPLAARAQSSPEASLSPLDISNFPNISSYLRVYDSEGVFVRGLSPADVILQENGQRTPVDELVYAEPGVQFVVALNPGPSFAIRDSQGNSRYDYLSQFLVNWAENDPAGTQDDLSLLTTTGPRLTHLDTSAAWGEALAAYQPEPRELELSFDILTDAIEVAADPPPVQGMSKAVLFITPPPDQTALPALQNLAVLAQEQDVRIYIWLVGSPESFESLAATQLAELAFQTGGDTFRYSGTETFPSPESYLDPLRGIYVLNYRSTIRSSSTVEVTAQVQVDSQAITTPVQSFTIEILPPNPVFLSLPTTIERREPESEEPTDILLPTQTNLNILVEYPDGNQRDLVYSALLVDGEIVTDNTTPPFDQFTWDLSPYTESREHLLKVIVEDNLALTGESIETPIQIDILGQPTGIAAVFVRQAPLIALLTALGAGAVLLWVLIVGGRLRPADTTQPRTKRRTKTDKDPVTQPVPIKDESRAQASPAQRLVNLASRLRWPQRESPQHPTAYLELIDDEGSSSQGISQPITEAEVTFGSAVSRATHLLEDPSISELHARLVHKSNGEFWLYDAGSIAGTWINYEMVPEGGKRLENGDLLHIGLVGYRFRLADETRARRIVISREDNQH